MQIKDFEQQIEFLLKPEKYPKELIATGSKDTNVTEDTELSG